MKRRDFFISAIAATAIATTGRLLRAEPKRKLYEYEVMIPYPKWREKLVKDVNQVFEKIGDDLSAANASVTILDFTATVGLPEQRYLRCLISSPEDLTGRVMQLVRHKDREVLLLHDRDTRPAYRRTSLPLGELLGEAEDIPVRYGWKDIHFVTTDTGWLTIK